MARFVLTRGRGERGGRCSSPSTTCASSSPSSSYSLRRLRPKSVVDTTTAFTCCPRPGGATSEVQASKYIRQKACELRCANREGEAEEAEENFLVEDYEEEEENETSRADFKSANSNNNYYAYDNDEAYEDEESMYALSEDEREKAYLVGVEFLSPDCEKYYSNTGEGSARAVRDLIASGESLLELERLANAAGLVVVGSTSQKLDRPRPATLIGKGKAFEVRAEARRLGATTVFFDCELSPSQAKNLDKILNKKVATPRPPPTTTVAPSTSTASSYDNDWPPADLRLDKGKSEYESSPDFTIDFEAAIESGGASANVEAAAEALFPTLLEDFEDFEDFDPSAYEDGTSYYDSLAEEEEEVEDDKDCVELEKVTVGDRTALILDIFSQRAATREGKLQVEMAQAQYQLPRLTRMWTHLEKQSGGGAANRGMGEKQIEVDKRLLRKRISLIKRDLENVRQQREQFRRKRARANIPVVALVGYTNAGKSSLLNQLSVTHEAPGQNNRKNKLVKAKDQLFATLDPTTRKVKLPSGKRLLVTDTVGFVQQLPSTLIAAFRATLEEIGSADLLIHVVDVSSPFAYAHVDAVESTLKEIPGAPDVPVIHAWNKIDLAAEPDVVRSTASDRWPNTVCISAATGEGVEELLLAIETTVSEGMVEIDLLLPYERGDLLDLIHSEGVIMDEVEYLAEGTRVAAVVPAAYMEKFEPYGA